MIDLCLCQQLRAPSVSADLSLTRLLFNSTMQDKRKMSRFFSLNGNWVLVLLHRTTVQRVLAAIWPTEINPEVEIWQALDSIYTHRLVERKVRGQRWLNNAAAGAQRANILNSCPTSVCVKGRDCVFITTRYTSATVNRADGYCSCESFELPAPFRSVLSVATLFFFSFVADGGEAGRSQSRPGLAAVDLVRNRCVWFSSFFFVLDFFTFCIT